MDEYAQRQIKLIHSTIADYRLQLVSLNQLIIKLEALSKLLPPPFWEDKIFPHVLNLEIINSELIEKKREANKLEMQSIDDSLGAIQEVSSQDERP